MTAFLTLLAILAVPSPVLSPSLAEAHEISLQPTLEEKISIVAGEYGIASTTLYNLAESESKLGKYRTGDNGKSCGVIHIHKDYYPEEHEQCEDDWYVLRFAAKLISEGREWQFTPCSCVQFVRIFVRNLPRGDAKDFIPNTSPRVGAVAVYNYGGVYHLGYITEIREDGSWVERGTNIEPCKNYTRFAKANKNLVGFYLP